MEAWPQEWNANAFGRYRIESTLGEGGMGIVYQAFDTHLHRTVALKVLRPSFLADPRHMHRFLLEARAASALNHPNICTVYDAGEEKGTCFIVLEHLQGETLRTILHREKHLPLAQVLQMGIAICHALAAAHQKGIIHRDIKPENIILTGNGIVKIMDFGLAKLKYEQSETDTASSIEAFNRSGTSFTTSMSSFLGTAAYMSPEQIQKTATDERTDLFSLGMVLYESISGQHPFQGQDAIAVMKSIVHDPPKPWPAKHRVRLAAVLEKAMAKNPEQRFRNATSMRKALQNAQSHHKSKRTVQQRGVVVSLAILLVLFTVFRMSRKSANLNSSPDHLPRFVSIGQTMETEEWPAFSPDGRNLVYSVKRSEKNKARDLWIKNIKSQRRKLFIASGNDLTAADWSPDGISLAYTSLGRGIIITDTAGIQQRLITSFGYMPRWSPDGKQLAFINSDPLRVGDKNEVYCCALATGRIDTLTLESGAKYAYPEWSPDGRWLIATTGEGSIWELCLIDPATKHIMPLTNKGLWIKRPVWSRKNSFIYFISNQNGFNEVWRQTIDPTKPALIGEPMQITAGTDIDDLDLSATSDQLLVTRADAVSEIWQICFSDMTDKPIKQAAKLLTINGTVDNLALSPHQDKIALEILEKGIRYFLVRSLIDSSESTLNCGQNMFAPTWSTDGEWLYFDAGGGNRADLYRMNIHGGGAEKVIASEGADWMPSCSPRSGQLCFLSNRSGAFQLWLRPNDLEPIQLTESLQLKSRATWSHDDERIAYFENDSTNNENGSWICVRYVKERAAHKVMYLAQTLAPMTTQLVWRWDDGALYYLNPSEIGVLCEFNLADRSTTTRRLIDFGFPFYQSSFALERDVGYFILLRTQKDIWITEGSL
jgi:eukaryotic-like serine/threonine-protein kinase